MNPKKLLYPIDTTRRKVLVSFFVRLSGRTFTYLHILCGAILPTVSYSPSILSSYIWILIPTHFYMSTSIIRSYITNRRSLSFNIVALYMVSHTNAPLHVYEYYTELYCQQAFFVLQYCHIVIITFFSQQKKLLILFSYHKH